MSFFVKITSIVIVHHMNPENKTSTFTQPSDQPVPNYIVSYVRHRSRVDEIIGVVVATVRNGTNGPEISLGYSKARGAGNHMGWVFDPKANAVVFADKFDRAQGVKIAINRAISAEPLSSAPDSFKDSITIIGRRAKRYFKNLPVNENYVSVVDDSPETAEKIQNIKSRRAKHLLRLAEQAKRKYDRLISILENKREDVGCK